MADYYQLKNQNIFNPPPNTDMGNVDSQYNSIYVQNALVLGNVSVTGTTIIAPRVSSIAYPGNDTAADTAGGQTITLNGTGFVAGASVLINGSAVGVVAVVSSTVITFTSPANATGSYVVYVINPDGSTAIAIPGIQYSGTPNWTTAAGSLGNVYETASFTQTVTATGDAPITYSVVSGSLPPGSTFNANGTITGTSQLSASPTTYSFTVRATDAEQQDTNRAFSISVIPDVVTWSSPANNTTYSPAANVAIANITLSATSAVGSGITYSANTLPTGLSLSGANISGTPTVSANTSSLLTATANTTSESSSITINWVVSVASDPYFMYNSLLLPGTGTNGAQNNTFLDGSTNNFAITRAGNTTQGTFSPYGPNWSNYFNGSSGVRFPDNAVFSLGTNAFTVEGWFNVPSTPSNDASIISKWVVGNDSNSAWMIDFQSGNLSGAISIGGSVTRITGSVGITLNTWNYFALVRSGSPGTLSLFLNGARIATSTPTGSIVDDTNSVGIGVRGGTDGYYLTGYVSNIRVINGTDLYGATNTTITVPTSPLTAITNTALLTSQSNRFKDNSTNNFAATVTGAPSVQRFSPFSPGATYSTSTIGGSGYFDGTGDYLDIPDAASWVLGNNFTIECWVYFTTTSGIQQFINQRSSSSSAWQFLYNYPNTGDLTFKFEDGNTAINRTWSPVTGQWYHIAVTRSSSTWYLFSNGIQLGATATNSTSFPDISATVRVGTLQNPTSESFYGYISDARVVKSSLYTSAFTPPTAPLTAVANTQLLLNYTNAGIIDNTMLNNLETVGNVQISTAQSQFGGGSMSFDGSGDYLTAPFSSLTQFGTGDFTIEFWIYRSAGSVYQAILDTRSAGTASPWAVLLNSSNQPYILIASDINSSIAIASATWTHVAFSRASGTLRIFNNGVQGYSGANSTSMMPTGPLRIGKPIDNLYDFNGYLDDIRITKGYARYTSNFTPPTAAFPTY